MTSSPRSASRPLRAALLGLLLGAALGGVLLLLLGARATLGPPPCREETADCALERELARDAGSRQLLFGGVLVLLAVGLGMLEREPRPRR